MADSGGQAARALFQAPQPGRLKLSEGIEDFTSYLVVERNCPNTTIRAYRNDLEQLAEFFGDKPASSVTIADLRAWLESMNHAPSTIGRKLATARSYFRFGNRLSDRAVRILLKKYAGINPHAFRHSYTTHLIDHGADVRDVQELLGHRSITSTQIYTHVSPVRKNSVYNKCHPRA